MRHLAHATASPMRRITFHQRPPDDADRPATEEEIAQITGEGGGHAPSAEEWLLLIAISALILIIHAVAR